MIKRALATACLTLGFMAVTSSAAYSLKVGYVMTSENWRSYDPLPDTMLALLSAIAAYGAIGAALYVKKDVYSLYHTPKSRSNPVTETQ